MVNSTNPALKKTYNGKEFQDELGLNWHDYGARNYDAALGRWFSIDPLAEDYFDNSPYNYVANSPIIAYDPDGKRISITGDGEYMLQVLAQILQLMNSSEAGNSQVLKAIESEHTFAIFDPKHESDDKEARPGNKGDYSLGWDLSKSNDNLKAGDGRNGEALEANSMTNLAHELGHFNNLDKNNLFIFNDKGENTGVRATEAEAIKVENAVRRDLKMDERTDHSGLNLYGKRAESYVPRGQTYSVAKLVHDENYNKVARKPLTNQTMSSISIKFQSRRGTHRGSSPVYNFYKNPTWVRELSISKK